MKIDVTIERIRNGYLVTDNDHTKNKTFYSDLEEFTELQILRAIQEADRRTQECKTPSEPINFKNRGFVMRIYILDDT